MSGEARVLERWKHEARKLKANVYALYFAYRDPRVPWYAKVFVACVVGYAFSPIDLIPDFVPVLGYLDDLVLIPLGVALALKMIPKPVMDDACSKANNLSHKPKNWVAGVIIIVIWFCLIVLFFRLVTRLWN
ncbi:MAG: hypothetical protein PWQ39_1411 [Thermacetogenium sp.]|nr:hypothetical protein [Thermacetogenium sp.]